MARIPVKFKRVAAAFDDMALVRLCESSGSEHSPENFGDLSDLVNSFIEKEFRVEGNDGEEKIREEKESESEGKLDDSEITDELRNLLGCNVLENGGDDEDMKRRIRDEAELEFKVIGDASTAPDFKRRLMSRLRQKGFDAGLCKSRWQKMGRNPAGTYEYIDVNAAETRYIVDVYLAGEFEAARRTARFVSLLDLFPPIFVGKPEELKQIVRLMCAAIRESMKKTGMPMPPWRRNGYMQSKWFGPYKRTINEVPAGKASKFEDVSAAKRSVGFKALPKLPVVSNCRDDFASKTGMKSGYLTAAFKGMQ